MGLYSNTDMLMNISDYTFHGQILHENICNPLFFPPKPDKQEMIQAFLGPHICRNLNHGSVGWLQDARTIVPKSSGLICTSYIVTTHTHTRGVLRLLCFDSPVLPSSSSSSSFGSFSSSFPFFLKCHTHRHVRALSHTLTHARAPFAFYVSAVQSSCCSQRSVSRKVMHDCEVCQGPVHGATAQEFWWPGARGPAGSHPSTCPPLPLRTDLCDLVCPHQRLGTVNHWINDHYLCIRSWTRYFRRQSDTLQMYL